MKKQTSTAEPQLDDFGITEDDLLVYLKNTADDAKAFADVAEVNAALRIESQPRETFVDSFDNALKMTGFVALAIIAACFFGLFPRAWGLYPAGFAMIGCTIVCLYIARKADQTRDAYKQKAAFKLPPQLSFPELTTVDARVSAYLIALAHHRASHGDARAIAFIALNSESEL